MTEDVRAARRQALGFSALVLLFAAIYEVVILRAGGMRAVPGVIVMGLMWVPLSVSFALRIAGRESFADVGWRLGPWRGLAIAYLLPAGCAAFTYGAALLTGVVSFAPPEKFAGQLLAGEVGVFSCVAYSAVALWLWRSGRLARAMATAKAGGRASGACG